jgi:hypothetical protein
MGEPLRRPRDTRLSAKVGTKFRQQVVVVQSAYFACRLTATELPCHWCHKIQFTFSEVDVRYYHSKAIADGFNEILQSCKKRGTCV